MLFYVTDLVPLCSTLLTLKLSGFGDAFGPFLAEELARGLGRINKVLTTLELAYNAIGDRGAEGLALALGQNRTLTLLLTPTSHQPQQQPRSPYKAALPCYQNFAINRQPRLADDDAVTAVGPREHRHCCWRPGHFPSFVLLHLRRGEEVAHPLWHHWLPLETQPGHGRGTRTCMRNELLWRACSEPQPMSLSRKCVAS